MCLSYDFIKDFIAFKVDIFSMKNYIVISEFVNDDKCIHGHIVS